MGKKEAPNKKGQQGVENHENGDGQNKKPPNFL